MSRVRHRNQINPPPDWETVKQQVLELNTMMRRAELNCNETGDSKEQIWGVMRANWKRSRFVFEARWRTKTMSDQLYNWICNQGYADKELIDIWRKPGYDRACCAACVSKNTNHGGTCICRVPKSQRPKGVKCFNCGCPGCCSGDFDSDSSYDSSQYSDEDDPSGSTEKQPIDTSQEIKDTKE